MAKRKQPAYQIRLFRGNRRIALGKLRYATSFEIWYGKRRAIPRKDFIKSQRKVDVRRRYFLRLIKQIEVLRLQKNEQLREKRKAAIRRREVKAKEIRRREVRKAPRKPKKPGEFLPEEREIYEVEIDWAHAGLPMFNKAYAEESPVFKNVEVKDTLIIPIQPDSERYDKQMIEKMMWSSQQGDYRLSIMNLTMAPDEFFAMEGETFADSYKAAFLTFAPHIMKFFEETRHSTDSFILRIKFMWQGDGFRPQSYQTHGLSLLRTDVRSRPEMLELIRNTFVRFFGPKDDEIKRGKHGKRNYLVGDRVVLITGFTLEGISYG